jgi:hypothetical protein
MNVCVILTMLMLFPPLALAQATTRTAEGLSAKAAQEQRLEELGRLQQQFAAMRIVRVDSIQQLVSFGVEQKFLAARTSLRPGQGEQVRVIAPNLRGFVRLALFGPDDAQAPDAAGRNFQLFVQDLSDPQAGIVYTSVSAVAGRLIVARDAESDNSMSSVQLIQDPPPAPGAAAEQPQPVRLLVHYSNLAGDQREIDLKLEADSFLELRRQYPREVDVYLRPIIRDFAQEAAVFAVDPKIAWQVLGQEFKPDDELRRRIDTLLAQLDADDFRQRQNALDQLNQIGTPAAMVLARLDRTRLSEQQASMVETFLAEYAPVPADQVAKLRNDLSFLLDVLFVEDESLRALAVEQIRRVTGKAISLQAKDNPESRAIAIARLREQLIGSATLLHPTAPAATSTSSR